MSSRSLQIRFHDSRLAPSLEPPCPLRLPGEENKAAFDDSMPLLESFREDSSKSIYSHSSIGDQPSMELYISSEHTSSSGLSLDVCCRRSPMGKAPGRSSLSATVKASNREAGFPQNHLFSRDHNMSIETLYIEIAPGITTRLRGAKETWLAVQNDQYCPAVCYECNEDLFCLDTAAYVLCPCCKVISPMTFHVEGKRSEDGGVGLGFSLSDLQKWQYEILKNRRSIQFCMTWRMDGCLFFTESTLRPWIQRTHMNTQFLDAKVHNSIVFKISKTNR